MRDSWLDPLLVVNRRLRFEHGPEDVAAAWRLVGSVEADAAEPLACAIVARVNERMRVLPTAFGVGMPRSLRDIVARRGGNCVSHAVLAAVLLRDRGLPTRLVVEDVHTNPSLLRATGLLIRAPVGPTLNGHVWLEVLIDNGWEPADAELGVFGTKAWLSARLVRGTELAAIGIRIREHWRFPLRIRRLGSDGVPEEDATDQYLVEAVRAALGGGELPAAWLQGVRYFSRSFRWEGRAGLRILLEARRLRAMSQALAGFAGRLAA